MIDKNNPAGRLYDILVSASRKDGNTPCREVWADVLQCEPDDDAEITRRVVAVFGLAQEVESLVRLIPGLNHGLYLASFGRVRNALFPLNLQTSWKGSKNSLSEDVLTRLQFCADELAKHYSEESAPDDAMEEISTFVQSAFSSIEASDIDPALRLSLLEALERVRHALATYRIHGAKGVKDALQGLLGSVVVNREGLNSLKGNHDPILIRLGELIDSLDRFTARVMKLKRIITGPISAALKFLTDGEGDDIDP